MGGEGTGVVPVSPAHKREALPLDHRVGLTCTTTRVFFYVVKIYHQRLCSNSKTTSIYLVVNPFGPMWFVGIQLVYPSIVFVNFKTAKYL